MKIDEHGEIQWKRNYRQIDSISGEYRESRLGTLVELPNGDIAATGVVINRYDGSQISDLWVIKVDSNGCFGGDNCGELVTSTKEAQEENIELRLYPNPVYHQGTLLVSSDKGSHEKMHYRITDINGRLIQEGELSPQNREIKLNGMTGGIYFVRLEGENGGSAVRKIVVVE